MQTIAIIALALFATAMVIIGVVAARRTKTMDSFFLGGRKIGAWMSAFAYGTTYFSAVIFVGYAGKHGWDIGIGGIWIGIGNALIGCLLAWILLARRTRRMTHALNVRTTPEFFSVRYMDPRMRFIAAGIIFIFLMPYAATVYKGLGSMFGSIFPGLHVNACIWIVACVTAVYLVLGGYVASAVADFIQGIIMIGGVLLMVIGLLMQPEVNGLGNALNSLREISPQLTDLTGGSSRGFLILNILLTSVGTWGLPQMLHKFYAIRDEKSIKQATVVSTVFALIIGVGAYLTGTFGRLLLNNTLPEGGYDAVMPTLLTKAFGSNIAGNILLAVLLLLLLSASMSTLSSVVLTSSSAVTMDMIQPARPKIIDQKQILIMRIFCFVFVLLSAWFATMNFAIIVSIMSFSWGIVSGSFIGPYIWGLYSRRITRAGAWAGMLGGFFTVVIMTIIYTANADMSNGLYAAFKIASANSPLFGVTAMGVSLVLTPLVSLFTKKLPSAHVTKVFSSLGKEQTHA